MSEYNRKGKHLTLNDRFILKDNLDRGVKKKEIAKILNCSLDTITHELKRMCPNTRKFDEYDPNIADGMYRANLKEKGKEPIILQDKELMEHIRTKIVDEKYSPTAILNEINDMKLFSFSIVIYSPNTIYRAIRNGLILGVEMAKLNKPRHEKKEHVRVQKQPVAGDSIELRDEKILLRKEFGHWEMDTIIGQKSNKRCCLVLTERKTRMEIIEELKRKTTKEVVRAINRIEKRFGKNFYKVFKTITCDNGVEFNDFKGIKKSLYRKGDRVKVYYCHPYNPSERGSNENNNIYIRYWLPKGANFDSSKVLTRTIIKRIQDWLNNYPRQLFDGSNAITQYRIELDKLSIAYII